MIQSTIAAWLFTDFMKLTNHLTFFCLSMGKVFEVTDVCNTADEANKIMERNSNTALIAEDDKGHFYLACQYGAKCPSDLISKLLR